MSERLARGDLGMRAKATPAIRVEAPARGETEHHVRNWDSAAATYSRGLAPTPIPLLLIRIPQSTAVVFP